MNHGQALVGESPEAVIFANVDFRLESRQIFLVVVDHILGVSEVKRGAAQVSDAIVGLLGLAYPAKNVFLRQRNYRFVWELGRGQSGICAVMETARKR